MTDDFLSGESGEVSGIRATTRAVLADALADARERATGQPARLRRAAAALPPRRVLVLAIERPDVPNVLPAAIAELARSRHHAEFATTTVGTAGKFENLSLLLAGHPADGYDWLFVLDDDVRLPSGFLDNFLFLCERFDFRIAQPAHRFRSHAAWAVTRRHPGSVARQTSFVEVGPVTAFQAETFSTLLPFPPLRFGWGLDHHWSAVARERGWPIGIIDATPVGHGLRVIASSYPKQDAIEEARAFLAERPYVTAAEVRQPLVAHRSWNS